MSPVHLYKPGYRDENETRENYRLRAVRAEKQTNKQTNNNKQRAKIRKIKLKNIKKQKYETPVVQESFIIPLSTLAVLLQLNRTHLYMCVKIQ